MAAPQKPNARQAHRAEKSPLASEDASLIQLHFPANSIAFPCIEARFAANLTASLRPFVDFVPKDDGGKA
jgi:hypothetical protein